MDNWTVLHEMQRQGVIWVCPECGRQVQTYPHIKILVAGDKYATHKGGFQIGVKDGRERVISKDG